MSNDTLLRGCKEILTFLKWGSWRRVARLLPQGFPARMVDGVWYSDKEEIEAWRRALPIAGEEEER